MKIITTILFLLFSLTINSQTRLNYKDIDKMDRTTIINLAKEKINEFNKLLNDTTFDYSLIDTIQIFKNKKNKKYLVNFTRFIRYVPQNSSYYYGYIVDLIENKVNYQMELNGGPLGKPLQFFHPTEIDREKIKFVLNALQLTEKDAWLTIKEFESYYEIQYESSGEKVDKVTGRRYDWWDEIIIIDPNDQLIETKFE